MKRLNLKKLVLAAYLLALVLWVVQGAASLAQGAIYRGRGLAPSLTLAPEDLEMASVVPYQIDYVPVEGYYVSSDSDPHLYWTQEVWVDTVILDVGQNKPAGGVELYYKRPGQQDFTAQQVVYPQRDNQGRYVFELDGKLVSGLRIDPDSVGGVLMELRGVEINPPHRWYRHFIPNAGECLVLLLLPLAGSALAAELLELAEPLRRKGRES